MNLCLRIADSVFRLFAVRALVFSWEKILDRLASISSARPEIFFHRSSGAAQNNHRRLNI
jgi:hypothetical protein